MAKKKKADGPTHMNSLRARAEELLLAKPSERPTLPTVDVQALVHELNVQQMELQLQNDELRQAQLELAHSRDRYSDLYDFAPVGYVTLDKDGIIREANLTAATLLGAERKMMIGANLSRWIARDAQDDFYLHRRAVFSRDNEAKQICELEMQPEAGKSLLVVRLESVVFESENARQSRTALIDITQKSQAEEGIRQLNETLEQRVADQTRKARLMAEAISHLGEGVMITSDELDRPGPLILFVNEAVSRITGYTADELIGQTPRILQGDRSNRATLARIKSELASGRSCVAELVNHRKDGTPYDAELFITPLFDTEGRRTNFVSIHRDITERKRAEQALRESEDRLRTILDTASDAIINIDQRGLIIDINPAAERMFGYTQEELIGQNVKILMPPPYRDEHDGYIARYLETGEARIIGSGRDVTGLHKDGSRFPIGLAVNAVDRLGLFTGIVRDISAVKELQKQVLEIAAQEDRRIGHELHDNIQQQLTGLGLLARTVADRLEKAAACESKLSDTASMSSRVADGVNEAAQHVHLLSRGLVPVEIDAEGLRSSLMDLAGRIVEQYGVECDFQCEGSVDVADNFMATHLYRIAQEAVNNAIKHGRAKRIEISLAGHDETLTLTVLDNGVGIGEKCEGGSGMGLRIMQYRASLIGAMVYFGPADPRGTLVTCTVLRAGG